MKKAELIVLALVAYAGISGSYSQSLHRSAYERAKCIAENRCTWSHDGWFKVVRKHYDYQWATENLAKDFDNWSEVYQAWNMSPKHKKNLDRKACEYGTAHYGNVYVLHTGCRRK